MLMIIETAALALAGGSVFAFLSLPLPWMLGAISALLCWNTATRRNIRWPAPFCYAGMIFIGYSIGRTFTQATLSSIVANLGLMFAATVAIVMFSLLLGWFTHRQTGVSLATGLLGTIPGGMSQVTVLCREVKGSDLTVVMFMQTFRLLAVIFVVPFVAIKGLGQALPSVGVQATAVPTQQLLLLLLAAALGGLTARFLRLPTPFLLGPILAASGFALSGQTMPLVPKLWLNAAQLSVGAYTGARVRLSELKNWRKLLPHTIFNVLALLVACLGGGWLLEYMDGLDVATAFLSMAPGGMAEMSLTGMSVGADLSVIVAFQLFRLLFLLLLLPPLMKLWLRRKE